MSTYFMMFGAVTVHTPTPWFSDKKLSPQRFRTFAFVRLLPWVTVRSDGEMFAGTNLKNMLIEAHEVAGIIHLK